MNLMYLLSPLTISLGAVALLFGLVLFSLDRRRAMHQAHLRKLVLSFASVNALQSFSVIVEAGDNSESIVPLLESLEAQNYPKLQVVVFVAATADKKLMSRLRRLQRQKRQSLPLRIVRKKVAGNDQALIRRYTNSDALVWIKKEDRLSKEFFTRMSFELLDESCDAISPRLALATDDTLRTASRALNAVAVQTVAMIFNRNTSNAIVLRRLSYVNNTVTKSIGVEHSTVTVGETPITRAYGLLEVCVVALILAVAAVSALLLPYGWHIVTGALAGTLVLLLVLRLYTYPYSVWTKSALTLMTPLWPLVTIALTSATATRRLGSKLWSLRIRPARQP